MAESGLTVTIGAVLFTAFVAGSKGQPGGVLLGQPVGWTVLRLMMLVAFAATVGLGWTCWRRRATASTAQQRRVGLLLAAGVLLGP